MILAVDPGREKCGVALVEPAGHVRWHRIVPRADLATALAELPERDQVAVAVIGSGTTSREVRSILEAQFGARVVVVDERNSTFEARGLYFAEHPPRGLWRLVPLSLQAPAEPIDDYAAVVLAHRYRQQRGSAG